ncbi:carotenoid 1,2-hydratase [bacterium]|nr:carotenoid 1,2-hydratase [bacterium]
MRSLLGSLLFLMLVPLLAEWYQRKVVMSAPAQPSLSVPELLGGEAGKGFAYPRPGRRFRFPEDHGPHPDFRSEWWYFTGNLDDYGYELTIFRQATLSPADALIARTSEWASPSLMMGDFAVSDVAGQRFYRYEKLSRAALGLAGSGSGAKLAWVEDWTVELKGPGQFRVRAAQDECSLDLLLTSEKTPVLQGENGYSRKGDEPEQSSYYYSLTRLRSEGTINGRAVRGLSWMDREWSTRSLSSRLAGWDWFSLQLEDGSDLMFYQLRQKQGGSSPWSAGTWVDAAGQTRHLKRDDVKIEVLEQWRSPVDGTLYPAGWKLQLLPLKRELTLKPRLADQELRGAVRYWEGAVDVSEGGRGYVELVGYDRK